MRKITQALMFLSLLCLPAYTQEVQLVDLKTQSVESELDRLMAQVSVPYDQNLFVVISANGCKFCDKEHELINSSYAIQKGLSEKFSNFFELNQDELPIPDSLRVPVTPAIFIINSEQKIIYTEYGYKKHDEFLDLIEEFGIVIEYGED